jgi:hypothetical protein
MADKGHTELPWSLNPHHPRLINGGPNHREVAKTSFGADGELAENTANANLIVAAVNTYPAVERLVKALEDWLHYAEDNLSEFDMPEDDCDGERLCPRCVSAGCIRLKIQTARSALSRFRSLHGGAND